MQILYISVGGPEQKLYQLIPEFAEQENKVKHCMFKLKSGLDTTAPQEAQLQRIPQNWWQKVWH